MIRGIIVKHLKAFHESRSGNTVWLLHSAANILKTLGESIVHKPLLPLGEIEFLKKFSTKKKSSKKRKYYKRCKHFLGLDSEAQGVVKRLLT